MIPNRYELSSIENIPLWKKFENNTIDKEKLLFLLVFTKMFSLSCPGRFGILDPEVLKRTMKKKKSEKKSPEKKTAYKKFLLYCKELEFEYPFIEDCFSKWIQEIPTAGFKTGIPLEFVGGWTAKSIYKKCWHSTLQERLYIGMNLYLLKKKNVTD